MSSGRPCIVPAVLGSRQLAASVEVAAAMALALVLLAFAEAPGEPSLAHASARAKGQSMAPDRLRGELRAVAVDSRLAHMLRGKIARAVRRSGVNALILAPTLTDQERLRMRRLARAGSMVTYTPLRQPAPGAPGGVNALRQACRYAKLIDPESRCAVETASRAMARALARSGAVDVTFVRVKSPAGARRLPQRGRGRIVALARLARPAAARRGSWRAGLRRAAKSRRLDLGVAPTGPRRATALRRLLPRIRSPHDQVAPRPPSRLKVVQRPRGGLRLRWKQKKHANRHGVRYGIYRDGRRIADSGKRSKKLRRLACGTSHLLEVDAVDRRGNRSEKRSAVGSTANCSNAVGPSAPGSGSEPPATVFLSPGGNDARDCRSPATACASLSRAYAVASLGEIVEMAAGSYPAQLLERPKAADQPTAPLTTFRPAAGASVTIGRLEIRVPHVEFRRVEIEEFSARYNVEQSGTYAAGDLTFRGVTTHHFALNSVQSVRMIGTTIGPNQLPSGAWASQDGGFIGAYPTDQHVPTDLLFDGVHVVGIRKSEPEAHSDCIQFTAGVNVTIRNSRFQDCEHADLMVKGDQGPIDGFLIENNFFDETLSAYYSINIGETSRGCRSLVMRHNTSLQNIRADECGDARMVGNIQPSMSSYTCSNAAVKLDWNVYESGVPCGPHDIVADVQFADPSALDLHLRSGSAAVDRGNPADAPSQDIDGAGRVGLPDAGADEGG
jgi:hypothetical protein